MSEVLRLTLLSHATTEAIRLARFPEDEPLNDVGRRDCAKFLPLMADRVWCAPERRTMETAAALGLTAQPEPALHDLDTAIWRGRTIDEVAAADLTAWLTDPEAKPHGGESITDLIDRVRDWQSQLVTSTASALIVTHPAVVRAMVLIALDAPPKAFWRIDVPPLGTTRLHHRGTWTLRTLS